MAVSLGVAWARSIGEGRSWIALSTGMGVTARPFSAGEVSSWPALGIVSSSRHSISFACMIGDEARESGESSAVGLGSVPRLATAGFGSGGGGGSGSGCGAIGDGNCDGGC